MTKVKESVDSSSEGPLVKSLQHLDESSLSHIRGATSLAAPKGNTSNISKPKVLRTHLKTGQGKPGEASQRAFTNTLRYSTQHQQRKIRD